jgi:NAD(P)H-dependent FMN reductase
MTTESARPLQLVVVAASGAASRSRPVIASWFVEQARQHPDFAVEVIDLAEYEVPQTLARTARHLALAPLLDAADAFVFVTAEYNHGYPGGLKNFIDAYRHEWLGKVAGFVSYGGRSGGLRAVEQLRQVIVEQHMVSIRDSLSFDTARHPAEATFPVDPSTAEAAAALLDQLSWWATALRNQRLQTPYKP